MTDALHVWKVNQTAWYLRLYVWLYSANPESVSFCSLFWGLLFAPAALIAKPFAKLSVSGLERFADWILDRSLAKEDSKGPWGTRHRYLNAWIESESRWVANIPSMVIYAAFITLFAFVAPRVLYFYVPFAVLVLWVSVRKPRQRSRATRFLSTAYHSLKDHTCPRIEVTR